jgi:cell division topological specificity factor
MFEFFRKKPKAGSSATAKERLQILLAHERGDGPAPDYLPMLQRDILEAIRRHVRVGNDAVDIRMERDDDLSSIEINIELPGHAATTVQVAR